ncbi:MAG TPA: hypothetical protein P5137_01830 [Candidatus Brocadiia bacterium]|nr:hypothetical protein [Candidatus Brocadiia bacterium]
MRQWMIAAAFVMTATLATAHGGPAPASAGKCAAPPSPAAQALEAQLSAADAKDLDGCRIAFRGLLLYPKSTLAAMIEISSRPDIIAKILTIPQDRPDQLAAVLAPCPDPLRRAGETLSRCPDALALMRDNADFTRMIARASQRNRAKLMAILDDLCGEAQESHEALVDEWARLLAADADAAAELTTAAEDFAKRNVSLGPDKVMGYGFRPRGAGLQVYDLLCYPVAWDALVNADLYPHLADQIMRLYDRRSKAFKSSWHDRYGREADSAEEGGKGDQLDATRDWIQITAADGWPGLLADDAGRPQRLREHAAFLKAWTQARKDSGKPIARETYLKENADKYPALASAGAPAAAAQPATRHPAAVSRTPAAPVFQTTRAVRYHQATYHPPRFKVPTALHPHSGYPESVFNAPWEKHHRNGWLPGPVWKP